jgi:hypothetical protein
VDVEEAFATGAGHCDSVLTGVAPTGVVGEIGGFRFVGDGQFAVAFELRVGTGIGHAGDGRLRIEQDGEVTAEGGDRLHVSH